MDKQHAVYVAALIADILIHERAVDVAYIREHFGRHGIDKLTEAMRMLEREHGFDATAD